jgi:hypothetical protein
MPHSHPVMSNESLRILTAIDESIATASCPTVEVFDVEATARWLQANQWDVDWDRSIDGVITIFGDRPSKSDEPENWVLRLVESVNA